MNKSDFSALRRSLLSCWLFLSMAWLDLAGWRERQQLRSDGHTAWAGLAACTTAALISSLGERGLFYQHSAFFFPITSFNSFPAFALTKRHSSHNQRWIFRFCIHPVNSQPWEILLLNWESFLLRLSTGWYHIYHLLPTWDCWTVSLEELARNLNNDSSVAVATCFLPLP